MALKNDWATGNTITASDQNAVANAVNAVNLAGALTTPPSSGWTTSTLGSATFAADLDGRKLALPTAAGSALRAEYRTLTPVAPYTATAHIEWAGVNANYVAAGMFLRSNGGAYIQFGPQYDTAMSGWSLDVAKWNSESSFNAHYLQATMAQIGGMPNWFRIVDDNTNRMCQYSFNGVDFITLHTVGRTDFLFVNQIGWGGWNSGGSAAVARLRSWSLT
jgi:hypothetical protein